LPKNPQQAHLDQKLLGSIPLVIGVTGHRDLRTGDRATLKEKVRDVLARLKTEYLQDDPETPIILLSALAEGADQLVADVALQEGAILIAPLPMELDEYREDFRKRPIQSNAETEFNRLMGQAFAWVELPYRKGNSRATVQADDKKRAQQYQDLGLFIVRNCHVLIALYNGDDTGLTGGTGEIVRFKRQGIPWALSGSTRAALDGSEIGPVIEIITPREKPASPEVEISVKPWGVDQNFFLWRLLKDFGVFLGKTIGIVPHEDEDNERRAWRVFKAISEQTRRFNTEAKTVSGRQERDGPNPEQSLGWLFDDDERNHLAKAEADAKHSAPYWCSIYRLTDVAAQLRQGRFRFDWLALFTAGFVAIVVFEVFAHLLPERTPLLAVYICIFGAIFAWFILARYLEHQERFLDYRALAEALRVAIYWKIAGIREVVSDAYPIKQPSELAWVKIVLRTIDMLHLVDPPVPIDMTSRSLDVTRKLWITGQRSYFKRQGDKHHRKAEVSEARSILFLAGSPLVGIGLLGWWPHEEHDRHLLIVAMGLAAGAAAVIAGYIEKLAHHAHARQYDRMYMLFTQALALVANALASAEERPAAVAEVEALFIELGREAMNENAEWVAIYRQRPIRPAG